MELKGGKYILPTMKIKDHPLLLMNDTSALSGWLVRKLANVTMVICRFLQFLGFHVCLLEWRNGAY